MKTPTYKFGDEVFFVEKEALFFGKVVGLSYVEKINDVIYLIDITDDANSPHQAMEKYIDTDRIALVTRIKEEIQENITQELIKYEELLKVDPNVTIVKKSELEEKPETVQSQG